MQDNEDPQALPLISQDVLDQLYEALEEDADMVVDEFLGDTPQLAGKLKSALAAGDLPEVAGLAHQIKSSSGALGGIRVQALAAEVEKLAREQDGDALAGQASSLLSALEAFLQVLGELRK